MVRSKWLFACVSALSILVSQSASAQPSAPEGAAVTEEVIVTARRREESLQDVPISVTAISGESLAQRNIDSIYKLQAAVPGVVVTGASNNRYQVAFAIRGQRVQESQLLNDPAVGTYFAEVVQPRPSGWGFTLYDLQNVQILKGVQGTLFGRNVTGGAILVEPAHPKHEWEGEVKGEAGNYGMWSTYGMLNIPVVKDKLAVRLNGVIKQRNGYTINVRTGRDYDNLDYWSGRASVLVTPNDTFESLTIIDVLDADDNGTGVKFTRFRTGTDSTGTCTAAGGCYAAILGGSASPAFQNEYARFLAGLALGPRKVLGSAFDFNTQFNPYPGQSEYDKLWNYGITNKTTIEIGEITLKNIFGFRHLDFTRLSEYSHLDTFRTLVSARQATRTSVYSEELRAEGTGFDDRLNWTVGAFGLLERGREHNNSIQLSGGLANPSRSNAYTGQYGKGVAISYALFGAGEYKLADEWKIAGGLRWNHDQRSAETTNVSYARTSAAANGQPAGDQCRHTINNVWAGQSRANCKLDQGDAWRSLTWDVSLNFEPTPDTTFYVAQRKGFRSGGMTLRPVEATSFLPFSPEFTRETELGVRKGWAIGDAQLSTSGALFYQNLTNVQVQLPVVVAGTVTTITVNTGSQKNYGGELEARLDIYGLELSGSYAFINVGDTINRPFNALIGQPKHTLSLVAQYTLPLDESVGAITFGGDITYRSHMHLDDLDDPAPLDADQSGYALSNFYLNWNDVYGSHVSLGMFVSNAFDKVYRTGGVFLDNAFATGVSTYGEPRMFGGSVSYKF